MRLHSWGLSCLLTVTAILIFTTCHEKLYPPSTATVVDLSPAMIDAIVEEETVLQNIVGITVGVVENGVVSHTRTYGSS